MDKHEADGTPPYNGKSPGGDPKATKESCAVQPEATEHLSLELINNRLYDVLGYYRKDGFALGKPSINTVLVLL